MLEEKYCLSESFHKFVRFDTELRKFKLNNKFTATYKQNEK